MAGLEAGSVDAVVTDPPYGLEFMGKGWDGADGFRRSLNPNDAGRDDVFGRSSRHSPEYRAGRLFGEWCERWGREALRVTKPGGYLLAFGGTRTHHRLVCALEDAGWIIRDELDWIYASGFPKGKANLKPAHEPIVLARKPGPLRPLEIDECRIGTAGGGTHCSDFPEPCSGHVGHGKYGPTIHVVESGRGSQSEDTRDDTMPDVRPLATKGMVDPVDAPQPEIRDSRAAPVGRWPSNVLLSDPELFDEPNPYVVGSGATVASGKMMPTEVRNKRMVFGQDAGDGYTTIETYGDSGGYSRFFIIPKADRAERERGLAGAPKEVVNITEGHGMGPINTSKKSGDGIRVNNPRANVHPTVKPIDLMRHLVRLVTPPGGTVLDPFLGSGTTAIAAEQEGFAWIGIEREAEYVEIARARLNGTQRGLGL